MEQLSSRLKQRMSTAHLTLSSCQTTRSSCHVYLGDRTRTSVAPHTTHPASSNTAKPPLQSCQTTILRAKTQLKRLITWVILSRLSRPRSSSLSIKSPRCPCLSKPETISNNNLSTKANSSRLNLQLIHSSNNNSHRNTFLSNRCR